MKTVIVCIGLVVSGLSLTPTVLAAPEPGMDREPTQEARPWAEGVSQEDQDAAIELFSEGTRLLKDAFFTRAVDLYKQALTRWDHPAIHFNLAKALMNLDQPVEAYTHLEQSMKFQGAPLDADQIEQVARYRQLLYETELAEIVVTSSEPGAIVTLNGTQLFKAPGRWQGVVRPGNVTLLASKEGFQTAQAKPDLKLGQKNDVALVLVPIESSMRYERAFSNAIPWVVIGTGVALLAGGGVSTWQASESFKGYDDAIDQCNVDTAVPIVDDTGTDTGGRVNGCVADVSINDKKSQGELFQTLSVVGYVAGGAVLATGFVLLYVNREKPITVEGTVSPVSIVPHFGPDGAGVTATIGF